MKTKFLLLLLTCLAMQGMARESDDIMGTWKYRTQSVNNDFRKVLTSFSETYSTEYFVFENNNKFRHEFLNEKGEVVKTLEGTWKATDEKIKIHYSQIDYNVEVDYFFLDNDLVLGQNFSHVIFTRYVDPAALPL